MATLIHTFCRHTRDVNSISFSPNSKILASASGDKTIRLWNVEDGEELPFSPLIYHTYYVNCCAFSPFGTLLATASSDCTICLWDTSTGKNVGVLEGHKGGVRVCCFSPNSQFLVSGSADESFCIWDVKSKRLLRCVEKGVESSINACCFTPDSLYIITGASCGDLNIWEGHSGKLMKNVEGHDLGVTSCVLSPTFGSAISREEFSSQNMEIPSSDFFPSVEDTSGSAPHFLLATGGNDNLVRLWSVYTASAYSEECNISKRCDLAGHQGQVWQCAFSPNGKLLASGSGDKTVILWDPISGSAMYTIEGHTRYVACCAFSTDGSLLATGSNDRTVRVWKMHFTDQGNLSTEPVGTDAVQVNIPSAKNVKARKKKLVEWSVDDVCKWLESFGMEQYCESFRQNEIDGTELSSLGNDSLATDLGIGVSDVIAPVGHRNKILRTVKDVKKEELDDNIPDEYLCPITREVMEDPVIAADGYSYERSSIESWLMSGRLTSPMTNSPLKNNTLTPNRMLKTIITRHMTDDNVKT